MAQEFSIAGVSVSLPDGWRELGREDNSLVVRSADELQQVTLSFLTLKTQATFEEFQRMCEERLNAEREQLVDGAIEPNPKPIQHGRVFGLVYSGGDRNTRRIFSTYLLSHGTRLVTLYLEGFAIAPARHTETFKGLIATLKSRPDRSG